jgi:hypothetical protein
MDLCFSSNLCARRFVTSSELGRLIIEVVESIDEYFLRMQTRKTIEITSTMGDEILKKRDSIVEQMFVGRSLKMLRAHFSLNAIILRKSSGFLT